MPTPTRVGLGRGRGTTASAPAEVIEYTVELASRVTPPRPVYLDVLRMYVEGLWIPEGALHNAIGAALQDISDGLRRYGRDSEAQAERIAEKVARRRNSRLRTLAAARRLADELGRAGQIDRSEKPMVVFNVVYHEILAALWPAHMHTEGLGGLIDLYQRPDMFGSAFSASGGPPTPAMLRKTLIRLSLPRLKTAVRRLDHDTLWESAILCREYFLRATHPDPPPVYPELFIFPVAVACAPPILMRSLWAYLGMEAADG